MASGPSASGLEFFLDTGGLIAAQVGLWLVFEISRLGLCAMFLIAGVLAVRRHLAKIMLGMLKKSLGGYAISRRRCFPCEH